MGHYDHEGMTPPTLDHRIHEELIGREEERVREEEQARAAGMNVRASPPRQGETAREAARRRVRERHGTPGPPNARGPALRVRPEDLADLSPGVTRRIAVRDGRVLIHGGGSTVRAECANCGRHEQSWALFDLRHIDEPVRSRLADTDLRHGGMGRGAEPGTLPPYACHGCVSAWIRSGLLTKAEWIRAHGGPEELALEIENDPRRNHIP